MSHNTVVTMSPFQRKFSTGIRPIQITTANIEHEVNRENFCDRATFVACQKMSQTTYLTITYRYVNPIYKLCDKHVQLDTELTAVPTIQYACSRS